MKKINALLILAGFCSLNLKAQDQTTKQHKVYSTTTLEYIFSWADVSDKGDLHSAVRFAPFFNFENSFNKDFSEKAGASIGLSISNIGFIYDVDQFTRKKVRTYNIGLPIYLKLGNMNGSYLFGGYSIELPFNYKEKTFVNEDQKFFKR